MNPINEMLVRLEARDRWTLAMYGHETYPRLMPGEDLSRPTIRNWPLQGFMADMTADYKPPQWQLDLITDQIQLATDEASKFLGISPALLLGQQTHTAVELKLKMEAHHNELEPYFRAMRDAFEPSFETWVVENYVLIYLQCRPHIVLCGINTEGEWVESEPKRFASSRRARQWARQQQNIVFYSMSIGRSGMSIQLVRTVNNERQRNGVH